MLDMITDAKNAIEAYNSALSSIQANIANYRVTGYKGVDISFQSLLARVMREGNAASSFSQQGGVNPVQIGQGMTIASSTIDFSQGSLSTGNNLSLAVNGAGLFVVSPDGGNTLLYTRAGDFQVDASGNLITSSGLQVYGFKNGNTGTLTPITGLTSSLYPDKTKLSFTDDGKLIYFNDNTTFVRNPSKDVDTGYQIGLTYFSNPSGLVLAQGTSFAETDSSGSAKSAILPGGAAGSISPRNIEQSNINYLTEGIEAQELNRALSLNLNMVKMASDIIASFINKIT